VELREPRDDDWPAILGLANRSVETVAGAGTQEAWLQNRRRPSPLRRHFVAVERDTLVGYAALESQFEQVPRGFRLFVVVPPARLHELGPLLLARLESLLAELDATEAWLVEYAADRGFLAFLDERGFRPVRRFRLEDGAECVVVSKRLEHPAPER
jgi:N-acetylglutamate synthase-like GNAT family acetyltransferase